MQRTTKIQRQHAWLNRLYNFCFLLLAASLVTITHFALSTESTTATEGDLSFSHLTPSYLTGEVAADKQATAQIASHRQPAPTESSATIAATQPTPVVSQATTTQAAVAAAPVLANSLTIAGRTLPVFYSSDLSIDAGTSVGLYGGAFLYGHNSAQVFGILASLPDGTTFTLTLNGQSTTYRIVTRTTLSTTALNANASARAAIYRASYLGAQHSLSIMTCAGTYDPSLGTNTHRLILFADKI